MSAVRGQEFRQEEVMNRTRAVQKGLKKGVIKGIVWENHIRFCFSCLCKDREIATMKLLPQCDRFHPISSLCFALFHFPVTVRCSFVSPNNCAVLSRPTSVVMMFILFIYITIESCLGKFNGNRVCFFELMAIKCSFQPVYPSVLSVHLFIFYQLFLLSKQGWLH